MSEQQDERRSQWYDNKELYEKLIEFRDEFNKSTNALSSELQETKRMIKEYNNLRGMLNDVMQTLNEHLKRGCIKENELKEVMQFVEGYQSAKDTKSSIGKGIRDWGIYIIAIISLFMNLYVFLWG